MHFSCSFSFYFLFKISRISWFFLKKWETLVCFNNITLWAWTPCSFCFWRAEFTKFLKLSLKLKVFVHFISILATNYDIENEKVKTLKSNDVYVCLDLSYCLFTFLSFSFCFLRACYSSGFSSFEWISNQIAIFLFK